MPESVQETIRAHLDDGVVRSIKGKYDDAIACFDKAIALNPNYALAYNWRGIAYDSKGEVDRAIADYTKAIALAPNVATAYTNRGVAYGGKGGYDRAIADFDEAITLNPNDANAYNNRGLAYKKKGDKEQAIADYRKALEINPADQKAKGNLNLVGVTPWAGLASREALSLDCSFRRSAFEPIETNSPPGSLRAGLLIDRAVSGNRQISICRAICRQSPCSSPSWP